MPRSFAEVARFGPLAVLRLHGAARIVGGVQSTDESGYTMGNDDKAANNVDDLGGKAKEAIGKVTGNESLENDGQKDQSKANLGKAAENVKDAFK